MAGRSLLSQDFFKLRTHTYLTTFLLDGACKNLPLRGLSMEREHAISGKNKPVS
jgi:hypothetical protein